MSLEKSFYKGQAGHIFFPQRGNENYRRRNIDDKHWDSRTRLHSRLSLMIPRPHPPPPPARYSRLGCRVESIKVTRNVKSLALRCSFLSSLPVSRSHSQKGQLPRVWPNSSSCRRFIKVPPSGDLHDHATKCEGPSNSTAHPTEAPVLLFALTRISCIRMSMGCQTLGIGTRPPPTGPCSVVHRSLPAGSQTAGQGLQ